VHAGVGKCRRHRVTSVHGEYAAPAHKIAGQRASAPTHDQRASDHAAAGVNACLAFDDDEPAPHAITRACVVGRDSGDADPSAWIALAQYFVETQIRAITDGGTLVLSRGELPASAPIVIAGIGADWLREVARRLSRECIDFDALIDVSPDARPTVSAVAPAASVAILGSLAENFFGHRMEA
jgi:hypothetical protein